MASSDRIRLAKEEHRVKRAPAGPRSPARTPPSGAPASWRSRGGPALRALGSGGGEWVGAYWARRALSLSSFPHSQSFPGSTAKCRGSNLCSESVRGITAGREGRDVVQVAYSRPGGATPQYPPGRPGGGIPWPGVFLSKETKWRYTQMICASKKS